MTVARTPPTPLHLVVPDETDDTRAHREKTAEALRVLALAFSRIAGDHHETAVNVDIMRHELQRIGTWVASLPQGIPSLPPMREEAASSLELAEHVGRRVAEAVEAETKNPSTPPPDAAKVASISKDVIAAAIMQLKAEQWDKLEQERKAAEVDRLASAGEKRRMRRQTIASGILALIGVLAFLIEHFATHPLH